MKSAVNNAPCDDSKRQQIGTNSSNNNFFIHDDNAARILLMLYSENLFSVHFKTLTFKKKLFAGNFRFAPKENVTFIPDKEISPVFANGHSTCHDTIIDNC